MKFGYLVLLSSIVFGIINSLFEVLLEKELEDKVFYHSKDKHVANIISSSIGGAIAILIYAFIEKESSIITKKNKLPIHDALGVVIGASIVYVSYINLL